MIPPSRGQSQHHRLPDDFFDRPADVKGTMKKGYVSRNRKIIYFIPKQQHGNPSFIVRQYQMLKNLQALAPLPALKHIELLEHHKFPIILAQQYVEGGKIIKPHQDLSVLIRMIHQFSVTHDPETYTSAVKNLISTIDTMIRVFNQKSLLIDDLQWIVSPEDLSVRIIDPFRLVFLDVPNRKYGQDQKQRTTSHLFGRIYHQFLKQQSDLLAIYNAVRELIGLPPHQIRPAHSRKRSHQVGVTIKNSKRRRAIK